MTKKLWQKNWKLDKLVETFETQDDLVLDHKLVEVDVLGTIAHALMLAKMGILSKQEFNIAQKGLREIIKLYKKGEFTLSIGDEDVHTKIENYLTKNYGSVGKKIHTGRSRNDQVLTATRLYTKQELLSIWEKTLNLIDSLLLFAGKNEFVPIPGYTHMQKAMPSSVGLWSASIAESLLDDLLLLKTAYKINNQSPLGSAAGFGVPLKLNRSYTAKLLGFAKVQNNSLYCQNSRGKIEAAVLGSLVSILMTINKFASDIMLFTTSEFNFFTISPKLCTGSSIMPQKKNVDVAELLRSKVHLVLGNYTQIVSMANNLISGYNRDLQDIKKPLFDSLEITLTSVQIADLIANNISPNKEILDKSLTPEIFATHKALELVEQGKTFREAYREVGKKITHSNIENIEKILKSSTHKGGTGNLGLEKIKKILVKEQKSLKTEKNKHDRLAKQLIENKTGVIT